MLTNVVEIDHIAHMHALEHEDPTLILYDFTAAFPSLARGFTLKALTAFGAPRGVIQIMNNFYRHNKLQIKLHGTKYGEFEATRGIRQGCPLSPLIFAIASDSLLRIIQHTMPHIHLRTFADDTALLTSWTTQGKKLHTIMTAYTCITTWTLTRRKPKTYHSGTSLYRASSTECSDQNTPTFHNTHGPLLANTSGSWWVQAPHKNHG